MHSKQYSPYGIGFTKKFIYNHQGAPVFYLRSDILLRKKEANNQKQIIDENIDFLITPYQPKWSRAKKYRFPKQIDYAHEREWRIKKDLKFEYEDIQFVVVKSNEDLLNFPKDIVEEIGKEKFLVMDNYKLIEQLWPTHIQNV